MSAILIQLDESTIKALDRVAPAAKRQRAEFIRQAVKAALRKHEYDTIRAGYTGQPDAAAEADDWSNADAFHA